MTVHLDIADHVATVTIDQPPVNALSAATMREITAIFNDLADSRDAHVAVIAATGDQVFSAGADIKDSERRYAKRESPDGETASDVIDPGRAPRECFFTVLNSPLPVIASVHGITLGAGLALIACADVIFASENATFGLPEITVGVLGGGRFLQRLVGVPKMRSMFFTGESITAAEMLRLGAVEQVTSREELASVTAAYARKVAAKSPIGLRLGKESLNRVESLSVSDGYQLEQDYTSRVSSFEDSKEARNSWREKREPNWSWR